MFVSCMMSQGNPASDISAEFCANRYGLNWANISDCSNSFEGDDLLAEQGDKTRKAKPAGLTFVPTIVYNNNFDATLQDRSLYDFPGAVCNSVVETLSYCELKKTPQEPRSLGWSEWGRWY